MTPADRAQRLLVVRPRPQASAHGGDEVVYRRSLQQLAKITGLEMDVLELEPVGRVSRYFNLVRLPPELTRYAGKANTARMREAARGRRCVLFFHEVCFPSLPTDLDVDTTPILAVHNIHSVIAASDPSALIRASGRIARSFERRCFADPRARLVCISQVDLDGLRRAGVVRDDVLLAPPGAPSAVALAEDAAVAAELVTTGSYTWWRKRRDLRRLAREARRMSQPIHANDAQALALLGAHGVPLPPGFDWGSALRFGLVSDRFQGGFKLKVLEYVANNCVVLSYADLSREFEGLPHADRFVRRIADLTEARAVMAQVAADGPAGVAAFREFKAACLRRYAWDRCLEPLVSLVRDVMADAAGP